MHLHNTSIRAIQYFGAISAQLHGSWSKRQVLNWQGCGPRHPSGSAHIVLLVGLTQPFTGDAAAELGKPVHVQNTYFGDSAIVKYR